jgi:hypothetical protein
MNRINAAVRRLSQKSAERSTKQTEANKEHKVDVIRDEQSNLLSVQADGKDMHGYDLMKYASQLSLEGKETETWEVMALAARCPIGEEEIFNEIYESNAQWMKARSTIRKPESRREALSSPYWELHDFCKQIGSAPWWDVVRMCCLFDIYRPEIRSTQLKGLLSAEGIYFQVVPGDDDGEMVFKAFVDEETILRVISRLAGDHDQGCYKMLTDGPIEKNQCLGCFDRRIFLVEALQCFGLPTDSLPNPFIRH